MISILRVEAVDSLVSGALEIMLSLSFQSRFLPSRAVLP